MTLRLGNRTQRGPSTISSDRTDEPDDVTPPLGVPIVPVSPIGGSEPPNAPTAARVDHVRSESPSVVAPAGAIARRFAASYVAGALVGAVVFFGVLTDWGRRPMRTANASGLFSNFYEIQARAILDGHLDVPVGSLSIEGFRVRGQEFMYFPPWPSLVRTPLLAITDRWDGRLTTVSMAVAYLVTVCAAGLLAWRVRCLLAPARPIGWGGALALATWAALLGGGSTITYLGALPWVYHEAYLWAIAGSVGTVWALLGTWQRPTAGRVLTVAVFATITILSRTTAGWALALGGLGMGALMVWRRPEDGRPTGVALMVTAIAALAVGSVVNWVKFRHPYMFPLENQVWTSMSQGRVRALRVNGGDLSNPGFIPTTARAYFRLDGVRFTSIFPWITLPAEPPAVIGDVVFDQRYRTGSVPALMPGLVATSLAGVVTLARRRVAARAPLIVLLAATLLIPGPIMVIGYVAHRYTAEFVPALVLLGAIGLTSPGWTPRRGGIRRIVPAGLLAALGVYGVAAHVAVATAASRETFRGDPLVAFVDRREAASPWFGADPTPVLVSDELPDDPSVDTLAIVGDCAALYVASGDLNEPWIPVAVRGLSASITIARHGPVSETRVVAFRGARDRAIALQHDGRGNYRLAFVGSFVSEWSDWFEVDEGAVIDLTIEPDTALNQFRISAPGWVDASVPLADWDRRWTGQPNLLDPLPTADAERNGLIVTFDWWDPPAVCTRLERTP